YYDYQITERRGSGKNARWVTVHTEVRSTPFLLRDPSGVVPINLTGAEIIGGVVETRNETSRRRHSERSIREGHSLYVLGSAQVGPSGDRLEIGKGDGELPYLVSTLSERELMMKKAGAGMIALTFGMSGLTLAALGLLGNAGSFAATDFLLAALLAPIFQLTINVGMQFNDLAFLKNRVERAWANIDVSLKKRADLLPGLQSVVSAQLSHESELQERIAQLRSRYASSQAGGPEEWAQFVTEEAATVDQFRVVAERYPELRSGLLTSKLFNDLTLLENEIALMREGYNESVEIYNTTIQSFPTVVLARLGGHERRAFFRADVEVHQVPSLGESLQVL
ncbi:MAG: LemA family protein, partial [Myxococcales bacterium]|nr:LemA family protein [Myxococcales bacterium]